jgi:hypothetical protein
VVVKAADDKDRGLRVDREVVLGDFDNVHVTHGKPFISSPDKALSSGF